MPSRLPPGDISRRNRALLALYPWKLAKLPSLPAHYLAAIVEHGIWGNKAKEAKENPRKFLLDHWGARKTFGLATVPTIALCQQVMNDPDRRIDFETFEEYHQHYRKICAVPQHPTANRWPVFLSPRKRERESFIDGWHRFHSYYAAGAKKIPLIWYADE